MRADRRRQLRRTARRRTLSSELDDQKSISARALAQVELLNQQISRPAPPDRRAGRGARRLREAATRKARPRSPTSASASTSRWRSASRNSPATAPTSSAACAKFSVTARISASSAIASSSSRKFCSTPARPRCEPEGKEEIDKLAAALKEIARRKFPPEIPWVLRVDGHTDARPINSPPSSNRTGTFPRRARSPSCNTLSHRAFRPIGSSPPASANSSPSIPATRMKPISKIAASNSS